MNPFERYLTFEDREHIAVVNHLKSKHPDIVSIHVPNEGRKSAFERYKHSVMGALKGAPDFVILEPKTVKKTDSSGVVYLELQYYGLLIELKAQEHNRVVLKGKFAGKVVKTKGKVSPEQLDVLNRLTAKKYRAVACFGAEEAIKEIDNYLKK